MPWLQHYQPVPRRRATRHDAVATALSTSAAQKSHAARCRGYSTINQCHAEEPRGTMPRLQHYQPVPRRRATWRDAAATALSTSATQKSHAARCRGYSTINQCHAEEPRATMPWLQHYQPVPRRRATRHDAAATVLSTSAAQKSHAARCRGYSTIGRSRPPAGVPSPRNPGSTAAGVAPGRGAPSPPGRNGAVAGHTSRPWRATRLRPAGGRS